MMKAHVFLLGAVMFFGMVQAQRCYKCLSITSASNISALPSFGEGFVPCDEDYKLTTVDCSGSGGCLKESYNHVFDIEGQGRVEAVQVSRNCGPALEVCESVTEEASDALRDAIDALLPSTIQFVSTTGTACVCTDDLCNGAPATTLSLGALIPSTIQFVSTTGTACGCTDDLCNGAPDTTLSLCALLASLLVSYIAMKR